ncbi:MAG: xylan 1,4-beta-xylosidase [Ruminococcus sp.]|jgi:hypothetical protein|nr:xylan 1,4-beta-xylosidase [Ruminococcus sp.]
MAYYNRFIKVLKESSLASATEIWIDRATGVNYIFHKDGYGGGLTVLLDRDGKPVVTSPEELDKVLRKNL